MENNMRISDRRQGQRRTSWLVEDWRKAHRWLSVQLTAVMAAFAIMYETIPAIQEYVPHTWLPYIGGAGAIGILFGRLKAQK